MSQDWMPCCGQAREAIGGIGCVCPREEPTEKIKRRMDTPESRAFWGEPEPARHPHAEGPKEGER